MTETEKRDLVRTMLEDAGTYRNTVTVGYTAALDQRAAALSGHISKAYDIDLSDLDTALAMLVAMNVIAGAAEGHLETCEGCKVCTGAPDDIRRAVMVYGFEAIRVMAGMTTLLEQRVRL